jgi:ABC-type multidrug transport system fused ATPase/permease subunit
MPADLPSVAVIRRGFGVLRMGAREQWRVFTIAVIGSALYGTMTVGSAYVIGDVVGRVVLPAVRSGHTTGGALAAAAAAIAGVALLKATGITFRRIFAGVTQYRLQATYRRRVTRQYLRLPIAWHQGHPTGELLSNANSDVESMWYPMAPLPFACGVTFMIAITSAALLLTDPVLAVVGFVVFPLVGIGSFVMSRRMSDRVAAAQQLRGDASGVAHESFDGALVVKALGREAEETERFARKAEDLRDALIGVGRVQGAFEAFVQAVPNLGIVVVLWVGSMRIASGAIDAGTLVRVAYLFSILAMPLDAIGYVLGQLPRAVVGWDRVRRVLSADGRLPHGSHRHGGAAEPAQIALQQVRFSYGVGDVLRDVTFDVPSGRTVAVVGVTGAGKSTLVNLVVRLVDPADGEVTLDAADLRDLAAGELSRHVAVVPQQTFLFDDTVRGNVTLGADLPDEEVWSALGLAQADRFVRALPAGLDTPVGERGTSLSGGQRQRIALARALVRRPRLLVLDDATSSVDPAVEAAILRGLRDKSLGCTVLVVAYRRATIALADEVVLLEAGEVLARGTHAELVGRVPAYRRIVQAYADAEAERRREQAEVVA